MRKEVSMHDRLKEHFRSAILIVVGATFLYYVAGLSVRASVVLALCFRVVFSQIESLRAVANFEPYVLAIGVKFPLIFTDLGLLSSPEDWVPFPSPGFSAKDSRDFNSYRFTALTSRLFARSGAREYSTALWIHEEIEQIKVDWNAGFGSHLGSHPLFFFRYGRPFGPFANGYEFGIEVDPEWWAREDVRNAAHPSLRSLKADPDGSLVLGMLPYGYFPDRSYLAVERASGQSSSVHGQTSTVGS